MDRRSLVVFAFVVVFMVVVTPDGVVVVGVIVVVFVVVVHFVVVEVMDVVDLFVVVSVDPVVVFDGRPAAASRRATQVLFHHLCRPAASYRRRSAACSYAARTALREQCVACRGINNDGDRNSATTACMLTYCCGRQHA